MTLHNFKRHRSLLADLLRDAKTSILVVLETA